MIYDEISCIMYSDIKVNYLNSNYLVYCKTGEVRFIGRDEDVGVTVKILILHYLVNAPGKPLTRKPASFRDIPGGGSVY